MLQPISVNFLLKKDVQKIINLHIPTGKIGDVKVPELEKSLLENPYVDSANVYLNLNGRIQVDLVQRVPAFRLRRGKKEMYVDRRGVEMPLHPTYAFDCMLVSGFVKPSEYPDLIRLIDEIYQDDFSRNYFVGIVKENNTFHLLTTQGFFKVELGALENIPFKIKGFKVFAEKHLSNQPLDKYRKISMKFDNQIVATLSSLSPIETIPKNGNPLTTSTPIKKENKSSP